METPGATRFIQDAFRGYYSSREAQDSISIPAISSREFGAGNIKKIDYRHKGFGSVSEFHDFLAREAPQYVSYSTARYLYPAAKPMEKKQFLGADLVFDLDSTYELRVHPDGEHHPVVCRQCLKYATEDASRFLENFLLTDFGFSRQDVAVNFSGSKGYHLHVRNDAVQQLSADARRQLCDYAAAYGVVAVGEKNSGLLKANPIPGTKSVRVSGPSQASGGWGKKALDWTVALVQKADPNQLKELGLRPKAIAELTEKREWVEGKLKEGNWDVPAGFSKFWSACIDEAVREMRVETDKPVTFDRSRLIRVPNTIHGSTGLLAKKVGSLDSFQPLRDAVALTKGTATVLTSITGSLELGGAEAEFTQGKEEVLPLSIAVMLVAKGKAVAVSIGLGK